jgi:hypothetical protein
MLKNLMEDMGLHIPETGTRPQTPILCGRFSDEEVRQFIELGKSGQKSPMRKESKRSKYLS